MKIEIDDDPELIKKINKIIEDYNYEKSEENRISKMSYEDRLSEFLSLFDIEKSSIGHESWYKNCHIECSLSFDPYKRKYFSSDEDAPYIMPGSKTAMYARSYQHRHNISQSGITMDVFKRYLRFIKFTCLCPFDFSKYMKESGDKIVNRIIDHRKSLPIRDPIITRDLIFIRGQHKYVDDKVLESLRKCYSVYQKLEKLEKKAAK